MLPDSVPLLEVKMQELFEKASNKAHPQNILIKEMNRLYEQMSVEKFSNIFKKYLWVPLQVAEKYPQVERTFDFVVNFGMSLQAKSVNRTESDEVICSSPDNDDADEVLHPLINNLFEHFIELCKAKKPAVRYRVCYLVHKITNGLSPDVTIEGDLFDRLQEVLLERTKDRVASVRAQALLALAKFQNPASPTCPVIKEYLFHLKHDPQPEIRHAVLSAICASAVTLPSIVERTRDQSERVRQCAYLILSQRFHIRSLRIATRVQLLREGLRDRSEIVRKTVRTSLIPAWLKLKGDDVLELLKSLDVQDDIETAESTLKAIFSLHTPTEVAKAFAHRFFTHEKQEKLVAVDQLTCEGALYWYCVVQYLQEQSDDNDNCLDLVMADLPPLCNYINSYVSQQMDATCDLQSRLEHTFVSDQLLKLALLYSTVDQGGRSCLNKVSRDLLEHSSVDVQLIKHVVSCYAKTCADKESCLHGIAEIIAELREPIVTVEQTKAPEELRKTELEVAKLSLKLHELKEQLEKCVQDQDFSRAKEIKEMIEAAEQLKQGHSENMLPLSQEMRIVKDDVYTLQKCLTIVHELLRQVDFSSLNPTLRSLMDSLILPGIQNEDPAVRKCAVKALGLCCLISKDTACQHFILFLEVSRIDLELIQVSALTVIFDILLLFGLDLFTLVEAKDIKEQQKDQEEEKDSSLNGEMQTSKVLVSHLSALLDTECQEIRAVVVEGISKLMLHRRLHSPRLFAHLVLLWFNPATESDTFLRHFLGVFLSAFAALQTASSQECIEEAFLPTVRILLDAPPSSPLSKVDVGAVMEFLLKMSSIGLLPNAAENQENTLHGHLALKLCNEILQDPASYDVRSLCKGLNQLDLPNIPVSTLRDLASFAHKMMEAVEDKVSLKTIKKFANDLNGLIKQKIPMGHVAEGLGEEKDTNTSKNCSDNVLVEESFLGCTANTTLSQSMIPETPRNAAGDTNVSSQSSNDIFGFSNE